MNKTANNKIHIDKMWGLFIGQLTDNVLHRHYALQLTLASKSKFIISDKDNNQTLYNTCFINSNIPHQFISEEISMVILINPISSIGHQLYRKYKEVQVTTLSEDLSQLSSSFDNYLDNRLTFGELIEEVFNLLMNYKCKCELENQVDDDRIYKAIQYLEENFDRIVSLEEIANISFLSKTRFLHLFKEKTNLNFRRYQLWNKLIKSLPYLENHSITETAHRFGFTDSSHYSRTFKETFGLAPKHLATSQNTKG